MSTPTKELPYLEDKALKQYEELFALFKTQPNKTHTVHSILEKAPVKLSPKALRLALLFVNGLCRNQDDDWITIKYNYTAFELVERGSSRYNDFLPYFEQGEFWTEETRAVLVYFFGPTRAPYAEAAWHKIPALAYQRGYCRRSFRAPNNPSIYQDNQLNFVISLNEHTNNPISMKEMVERDWERYDYTARPVDLLWAMAIEAGNEGIYQTLLDIVYQRQERGKVSKTIIKSLLLTEKEEAWKAVEALLLSAQRQEGLRQTIMESLDETSLGALLYFMKSVVKNDLLRFSSVVRSLDVWAGLGWEGQRKTTVKRFLELGIQYLQHPSCLQKAVVSKDNAEVYMALWAQGVLDGAKTEPLIQRLYEKGTVEKRCLALYFLGELGLDFDDFNSLEKALYADSPKVFAWGIHLARNKEDYFRRQPKAERKRLFDALEARLPAVLKEEKIYHNFAFEWIQVSISKTAVVRVLTHLIDFKDEEEVQRLQPYFSEIEPYTREHIIDLIFPDFRNSYNYSEEKIKEPIALWQRRFALQNIKDRASGVQQKLLRVLSHADLSDQENEQLEGLLQRKGADLRRNVLKILLKQAAPQVQRSTGRLLTSKSIEQRLGGLDLLQQVQDKEGFASWATTQAKAYQARAKHSKRELLLLENLFPLEGRGGHIQYTWENGLGLYNPTVLTPTVKPSVPEGVYLEAVKQHRYGFSLPLTAIKEALAKLSALLEEYKNYSYEVINREGAKHSAILGEWFTSLRSITKENPWEGSLLYNYPLPEIWLKWYEDSQLTARDLFLLSTYNQSYYRYNYFSENKGLCAIVEQLSEYLPALSEEDDSAWDRTKYQLIEMLSEVYPYKDSVAFIEGLQCRMINSLTPKQLTFTMSGYSRESQYTWKVASPFQQVNDVYESVIPKMTEEEFKRFWAIGHWLVREYPNSDNSNLPIQNDVRAYTLGLLTEDELYNRLLHPDVISSVTYHDTGKKKAKPCLLVEYPFLEPMVERCKTRILEMELLRGDSATLVSEMAVQIRALYGVDYFVKILQALGKETLHRGYSWGDRSTNKKQLLSTLLERVYPNKSDDAAHFEVAVKNAELSEKRLIEAALYAPQWLDLVAGYLGWKGLTAAAWWLQAHTRSYNNSEATNEIAHYSKVRLADFEQGAVDIQWFKKVYKELGKKHWKTLYDAAKYLSTGGQHKRAQLFADVILGQTKITAVTKRIKASRNQDYLRVYGLVPLSRKTPERDLLKRYQFIQQFKKESKQFGSQKQSSEASAVKIALENLARTAGYDDPLRLTWAMESKTVQAILAEAKPIELDDTTISLHIDPQGKAQLQVQKSGKELASIPAKHRKNNAVKILRDQIKILREQLRRTRRSLEQAMVNGDSFRADELADLQAHPVVAPLLQQLVFESDGQLGFLTLEGLVDSAGKVQALGTVARLAHPYDLYASGDWSAFQRHCFEEKIKQPFKQIFRNLYLPTADERAERVRSRRYAGHQVQPKKTVALLKGRGWTVDYHEGLQKVFHEEQLVASLYAAADWFSPADVEVPTLEYLEVFNLATQKRQALDELPPRLFSELMRDVDLVVSVAHVGGVDPEASQSTLEMRAVLVEETARLFKLENVSISQRHAHIKGQLGDYTVHLGSGGCHQLPGNYLSILAVPSQHRGRIFLPFVDDDPRTAEVLSKILLLAKDHKIQDPTILQQLDQRLLKK